MRGFPAEVGLSVNCEFIFSDSSPGTTAIESDWMSENLAGGKQHWKVSGIIVSRSSPAPHELC